MTKRVNRNFRTNLSRFLTGLFVGGVLLFQGTGYITSNLTAAENQNVNVATDGTTTPVLISDGYNGLIGPSGEAAFSIADGGTLSVGEGITAVLGQLDTASDEPYPTNVSEMTLESGSTLQIDGNFLVYGLLNDVINNSILTVNDGANIIVSNSGCIKNGTADGATDSSFGRIILMKGGTMTLGTADATETLYSGVGTTANMGTIQVNNKAWDTTGTTGDAYKSIFRDYYDYNLDDTTDTDYGTLTATGKVVVGAANIFGTVTANELQIYSADSTTPTSIFKSGSTVAVTELLTVGTLIDLEEDSIGSDLVVSTDKASAGGLYVYRNSAEALGGSLTVSTGAVLAVTGLSNESGENYKFDASGAQGTGESNLYDIYLDFNLANAGTINFGSSTAAINSGIAFTGDASGASVTDPATGLSNTGTITAYGSLALLGKDIDATQTATINNTGTITVVDALSTDYDSAAGLTLTNTGTISAGSYTLNNANVAVANSGTGTFKTQVLTLSNGSIEGSFVALEDTDGEGNTVAGYTSLSGDQTVNLTNNVSFGTETDAATAQFEICDTAKMSGDYTVTFTNTDAVNSSELSDTSAIDVKEMIFGDGASYSYGKKIDAAMTFNSGSTLWVYPEDETLTLGANDNLSVAGDATIVVNIAETGTTPQIVLSGTGTAALAEGSKIEINNLSELGAGDYDTILIKTEAASGNTFASTLPEISSVFYSLTDNRDSATDEYVLSLSIKGFEDVAASPNQRSVGRNLDSIRVNPDNYSAEFKGMLDDITGFTSIDDVNAAFNALSGVDKANSLMIAVTNPWANPFDRMDQATHRKYTPRGCSGDVYRGQSGEIVYEDADYVGEYAAGEVEYGYGGCTPIRSLLNPRGEMAPNSTWATFHHTSFNARTDDNSSEYGISRTGVTLGYDLIDCDQTVAGLSFDYSQPFLYGTNHRINTSNFNLGFYGRRDFWNGMNLSVYIGGGVQDYTSKRTVEVGALREYHKGCFNGGSLAGAIRLGRDYDMGNWTILRPVVQFDTQQIWQEAFSENGGATALNYDKADLNRSFVRAGLETETNTQFFRFTGRALYAGLIGGDEAPNMTASFADVNVANSMIISGVDLGSSFLDLGVGALGYLDCEYRWMIAGNYDFAAGDKSKAHTGSVSLSYFF